MISLLSHKVSTPFLKRFIGISAVEDAEIGAACRDSTVLSLRCRELHVVPFTVRRRSLVNADGMVGEGGKVLNIQFKLNGERVHDGEIVLEQARVFDGNAGRVVVRKAQEASVLPSTYLLFQNFPNPFNPSTEIRYQLPESGLVRLVVYDLLGRTVRVLVDGPMEAGIHAVAWDGKDGLGRPVGSGIVLVRMEAGDFVAVRKMVVVR